MKTKYCKRCDKTLPTDDFTTNISRSDGFQPYCIICMRAYRQEHYRANKQQYYDRNKKTIEKLRWQIQQYKINNSCVDCNSSFPKEPWLLEFDHLDASKKLMEISKLRKYGSWKKIKEEIDKCDLVCVLCHRRRTAQRAGWTI